MKKSFKIILLTLFAVILSNCEIKPREANAVGHGWNSVRTSVVVDELGCSWFLIYSGRYDGGVYAAHHPTCKNPKH